VSSTPSDAALKTRIDTLEETYETCLGYAAQGVSGETSGGLIREALGRADAALSGLADLFLTAVAERGLEPTERYRTFIEVLRRDAFDAQAAIQLVLGQERISSQLVDNLNASLHVRALLTDMFIIDEILNPHVVRAAEPS
jgi:hypothetical protein